MADLASRKIREDLEENPNLKFGFVVFRCTYDDDAKWERFMEILNTAARGALEEYEIGETFSRIDWSVQQDPSLDGVDHHVVRDRFKQWISESNEPGEATARFHACIMVDQTSLDEITDPDNDPDDFFGPGNVTLITARDGDPTPEDDGVGEYDSFVSASILHLLPRIWYLLEGPGWSAVCKAAEV